MAIKDFVIPYNDTDMRYDYKDHRYILEVEYASWAVARNLVGKYGSVENVEALLETMARVVYEYVLSFKKSEYKKKMTYYLSHSMEIRESIRKVMVDVLWYGFQEGGWAMAYVTGINLQEAKNIDNIKLKTAVGMVADAMVQSHGLKQQGFPYVFSVVASSDEDRW